MADSKDSMERVERVQVRALWAGRDRGSEGSPSPCLRAGRDRVPIFFLVLEPQWSRQEISPVAECQGDRQKSWVENPRLKRAEESAL